MTVMMRVLVVDDEGVARRRLLRMLGRIEGVEVAGEASSGEQALERIAELSPDVVLLDIRMPGLDGLGLVDRLKDPAPAVIFTTAFQEYAVRAFEQSAVDYLLKPVEQERLEIAIKRAGERRQRREPQSVEGLQQMLKQLIQGAEPPRLTARLGDSLHVFDPRQISRFHAQEGYTGFCHQGHDYLIEESIVSLADRLGTWGFVRVHRGELINLNRVRALLREDDQTLVDLGDGQRAPVSRRHLPELRRRLGIASKT